MVNLDPKGIPQRDGAGGNMPPHEEELRLADEIINLRKAAEGGGDAEIYEELLGKLNQLEKCFNQSIKLWDARGEFSSTDFTARFKQSDGAASFAQCSPCDGLLICGGPGGRLYLLDASSVDDEKWMRPNVFVHESKPIRTGGKTTHSPIAINAGVFSPDGSSLALGLDDGRIRVYSVSESENGRPRLLAEHKMRDAISSLVFSPTGTQLVAGGSRGYLALFKLPTGGPGLFGRIFSGPVPRLVQENRIDLGSAISSLAWNPREGMVVAGLANGRVLAFSSEVHDRLGYPHPMGSLTVSPSVAPHRQAVLAVSFNPTGRFILAGGAAGVLMVKDAGFRHLNDSNIGTEIVYDEPIRSAAFSPRGTRIVVAHGKTIDLLLFSGNLHVKDPLKLLARYESTSDFTSASFTSDGSKIAASTVSGDVIVFAPR